MDPRQSTLASASTDTGQTTIRASVLNEQVIEVAPGWVHSLEQALPHARYRAIALYDARGEVLHCTSTDFGIEFRQALNDALDAFVLGAARESRFLRGEGTRTAVMLALRDLHSALQGVCLLVVEDTPPEDLDPAARFLTPAVQTILTDIASEVAQTLHAIPQQKPQKPKPPVPLPLEAVYAQIREQDGDIAAIGLGRTALPVHRRRSARRAAARAERIRGVASTAAARANDRLSAPAAWTEGEVGRKLVAASCAGHGE